MGFVAVVIFAAVVTPVCAKSLPVKPGDLITPKNAWRVRMLVSPGAYYAVRHGMEIRVVPTQRIKLPVPYKDATEKYSSRVRLSSDHRSLVGYVAGLPFPHIDINDPYAATKIIWNSALRPMATDDFDVRDFKCEAAPFSHDPTQKPVVLSLFGHLATYNEIGRTEVKPLPTDPDFKGSGIWWRSAAYPLLAPGFARGEGVLRYRYWDANRPDELWRYLPRLGRLVRAREPELSSGFGAWGPAYAGGFAGKPQDYNYRLIGERKMLACVHAAHAVARPCPANGNATVCAEDWEMRRLYVIQVTPRHGTMPQSGRSSMIVYVDSQGWFTPYMDSYDIKGELYRSRISFMTSRDRATPEARVAVYPFKREFVVATSSINIRSGMVTTCYMPAPNTSSPNFRYINMGAVNKDFFTAEAMKRAGIEAGTSRPRSDAGTR